MEEEVECPPGPKTTKHDRSTRFQLPSDSQMENSNLGASSLQMKSLLKSFSNGNFQYYENLHKKYFEKAKEATKPLDKSSENLFSLTSKTGGTVLGMSQLKQSIGSLKSSTHQEKSGMLRASSLNAEKSKGAS